MHEEPTAEFFEMPPPFPGAVKRSVRGDTIGPYKILSLLGEGGFGSVYLAEQSEPVQRRVALKLIKPGMDSRSVIARFEAERQVLALLDHPSVAKVFDAGLTADGRPYIAMELVTGETITRFCEQDGIDIQDRVRLMIQVCSAVQHAHMKGVLHRDLKPSNILVTSAYDGSLPKIIDFGVAKALHQRFGKSTVFTEMGQMIGTPDYMSPEQARGSADVDTRADIYALGAILYELLTGIPPLDVRSRSVEGQAALERTIAEEHPPAPSHRLSQLARTGTASTVRGIDPPSTWKRVRGDLDWIVLKCLEKERSRRYQSAAALAEDLERYLNDEPVLAGPPSTAYLAAKFFRRHRVGVTAAIVVLLTIALGVGGITYALGRAVQEAESAKLAREESEAVTAFLTQMIQSVDPDEVGRDVTVREVLDRSSADIESQFTDRPLVEAQLRHAVGISYWQLGLLHEADSHLTAAVELRKSALGENHIETLRAIANLGSFRLQQGRIDEAEQLLQVAFDGFSEALGGDHPLSLGVANNLAVIYGRRGESEKSLAMTQRIYEGQQQALGENHPHTLGSLTNLASQLAEMGRIEEAQPLMREAVDRWERAHGTEKPGTLNAMHALAMMQRTAGALAEAEQTMRRVVELRKRVLGENHMETLAALANLGMIQRSSGRIAEAQDSVTTAWSGMRIALGDPHPTTVRVLGFLVDLLEAQGWPASSAVAARAIIESATTASNHDEIPANELNTLAWALLKVRPIELRDVPLALRLAQKACDRERAGNGADLWMFLDTLASAMHASGRSAEALDTQREAIALLPASGERYRAEMEQRAAEYETAVNDN